MFDLAQQVLDWRAAQRDVLLVRVVAASGMGSTEPADALAYVDDGGRTGRLLAGAADGAVDRAVSVVRSAGRRSQVLDVVVGDAEAHAVGLTCGGHATLLLQPADDVPMEAWMLLAARSPVCLVSDLDGPDVGRTTVLGEDDGGPVAQDPTVVDVLRRGATGSTVVEVEGRRLLVAPLWPTPRLVVVGDGHIADALVATAGLMSWIPVPVTTLAAATGAVRGLGSGDGVIVLSHDPDIDAPALQAALAAGGGYTAALGSRHTQARRREWLTAEGVSQEAQARIHGPAGLDIGARTPQEVAVAVVGQMVAVRAGAAGGHLSLRGGPIHP